jgi:catechol 2,3-dioxygenase
MYATTIDHAMLYVRELEPSITLYTTCLNLRVTEVVQGKVAFLTSGGPHHEVALYARGDEATAAPQGSVGLYHLAFSLPDKRSFAEAYRKLVASNVKVSPVDHQIGWGAYFSDPDGNRLEIYCDTRNEPDGASLWQGNNRPLLEARILTLLEAPAQDCDRPHFADRADELYVK